MSEPITPATDADNHAVIFEAKRWLLSVARLDGTTTPQRRHIGTLLALADAAEGAVIVLAERDARIEADRARIAELEAAHDVVRALCEKAGVHHPERILTRLEAAEAVVVRYAKAVARPDAKEHEAARRAVVEAGIEANRAKAENTS